MDYKSYSSKYNIDISVSKIRNSLNNLSNKLLLMHYIPKDQKEKNFTKKREIIYEFCKIVWDEEMSIQKDGNRFPQELWNGIDDSIIEEIIKIIEKNQNLSRKYDIDFIKKFLEFLLEYYPREIKNHSIFPNQNGKFCIYYNLYKDLDIPDIFKDCLKKYLSKDIKD